MRRAQQEMRLAARWDRRREKVQSRSILELRLSFAPLVVNHGKHMVSFFLLSLHSPLELIIHWGCSSWLMMNFLTTPKELAKNKQ